MQLRHIRPRSVEWYDAVEEDGGEGQERFTGSDDALLAAERGREAMSASSAAMWGASQHAGSA